MRIPEKTPWLYPYTNPPRQAKQAIQKTLMFLTRAAGPDAPVRAARRASAAPSTPATGAIVYGGLMKLGWGYILGKMVK